MAQTEPESRAQSLLASYERAGYARVAPAILQPAEPFLDLSGEDIRSRMFLTSDNHGRELCLRPDFTIAVSCDYLASAAAGKSAGFCYLGSIFRQGDNGPSEHLQAGIESFGRTDTAAADAEMLSLGLEAAAEYGVTQPEIRMGDVGLFTALVDGLDLAPAWKRRLIKDFNRAGRLERDLDLLAVRAGTALQLLTHPIWWLDPAAEPAARLDRFLDTKFAALDRELAEHCEVHVAGRRVVR